MSPSDEALLSRFSKQAFKIFNLSSRAEISLEYGVIIENQEKKYIPLAESAGTVPYQWVSKGGQSDSKEEKF